MLSYTTIERDQFNLTEEGNEIADSGSHEAKVFNAVDVENGIAIAELAVRTSTLIDSYHFTPPRANL